MNLPAGSIIDPYEFTDRYSNGHRNTQGKTIQHPSVLTGNVGVFICAGQSLICATENTLNSTTNTTKVHEINIFDGGLYEGAAPSFGGNIYTAGGTWVTRFADKLITDGTFDHVVYIVAAMGGTTISEWQPGGDQHQKLLVGFRRVRALGLTPTAVLWQQGEADHGAGTSQSSYKSSLDAMIGAVRAAGEAAPWFLAKSTWTGSSVDTGIQAAITSKINGTDIFAGANTDSLDNSNRHDNIHLNGTGSAANALLWASAVQAGI